MSRVRTAKRKAQKASQREQLQAAGCQESSDKGENRGHCSRARHTEQTRRRWKQAGEEAFRIPSRTPPTQPASAERASGPCCSLLTVRSASLARHFVSLLSLALPLRIFVLLFGDVWLPVCVLPLLCVVCTRSTPHAVCSFLCLSALQPVQSPQCKQRRRALQRVQH